jgi:hypothetical protein
MNIQNYEGVIQQGQVYEAYDFNLNGTMYYFTSNRISFTLDTNHYLPLPITRDDVTYTCSHDPTERQVIILASSTLAQLLVYSLEVKPLFLRIKKYVADATVTGTPEILYTGYAKTIDFADGFCKITFYNLIGLFNYNFPRVTYQGSCNNIFGDTTTCQYTNTPHSTTVRAIDTTKKIITTNANIILTADAPTLGKCYAEGTYRLITSSSVNGDRHVVITLMYPFSSSFGVNSGLQITLGCDKLAYTCKYLYGNLIHFVGMPYIPIKDSANIPIAGSL